MKILYITSVLGNIGGSEIYTRDLIKELAKRGHEIFVVTNAVFQFPEKNVSVFKIPIFGHHAFHKFQMPLSYFKILEKVKEFQPDIIQCHSNSLMGLIGHILKKKFQIPMFLLIESVSDKNANIHTELIFRVEKFLMPKLNYNKLIVWTENIKNKFCIPWGISEKKIKVIPAALNLNEYPLNADKKALQKKHGKHLIISIKSLWGTNTEGLKTIVEAMKFVHEKHPEYKYLIFGWGPGRKDLEELAEKLGLRDCVQLMGAFEKNEKNSIFSAAEITPHSLVYEVATSISLLECMAFGKACVVTDIGAIKDVVKDTAILVKQNNPKSMSEGIIKLIENTALRKKLEKKARKLVEKKYSIQSTVNELEKLYYDV